MMKFTRPPAPACLKDNYRNSRRPNYRRWGHNYKKARDKNNQVTFRWRSYKRETVDKAIREKLVEMTSNHCSFCDSYPLGTSSHQSIEHFRPKSKNPRLAYTWANLFLCCDVCQSKKGEDYNRKLLKPDRSDYSFNKYFIVNYSTGEIEARPYTDEKDREKRERAEITIRLYGLNDDGRPVSRLRNRKRYKKLTAGKNDEEINDFPYRFFLQG